MLRARSGRRACWPGLGPPSCRSSHISTRCDGCSSPWGVAASRSRFAPASTIGSGGGGDRRAPHRNRRQPVDAGGAALLRHHGHRASVPVCALAVRRANETASPKATKARRKPLMSNSGCWRLRLTVLAIVASWLTGCATGGSEPPFATVCPPAVEYTSEVQAHSAGELRMLHRRDAGRPLRNAGSGAGLQFPMT